MRSVRHLPTSSVVRPAKKWGGNYADDAALLEGRDAIHALATDFASAFSPS